MNAHAWLKSMKRNSLKMLLSLNSQGAVVVALRLESWWRIMSGDNMDADFSGIKSELLGDIHLQLQGFTGLNIFVVDVIPAFYVSDPDVEFIGNQVK